MDLGIAGRTAIVCASSGGLGLACATELARAGAHVVMNGRDADALAVAADSVRAEAGADVLAVPGDIGAADVQAAMIDAAGGVVDILVNNNGGPPSKPWREFDDVAIHAGVASNMVTPIAMVRRVVDGMAARGWGRIVCITSGSVKAPSPGLDLSSGARLGLHGFLAGVAREVAGRGVTINFLLPGAFDTRRLRSLHERRAAATGRSPEAMLAERLSRIPAGRVGDPAEFGAACAFLCSAQAGYITGQSLLIDGGTNSGVF